MDEVDDLLEDKVLTTFFGGGGQCAASRATQLVTPLNRDEWRELLSNNLEAKTFKIKARHRRDGFKIAEGLLHKNNGLSVPQAKRQQLLRTAHRSEIGGHSGIKATLDKLDAFWWPQLQRDAANHAVNAFHASTARFQGKNRVVRCARSLPKRHLKASQLIAKTFRNHSIAENM